MSHYIKEIYRLRNKQYSELMEKFGEKVMMEQYRHFQVAEHPHVINEWWLTYYIDLHGDFVNTGRLKHHIIARAIFNSMTPKRQVEVLTYIDDHVNDNHYKGKEDE